jgi:hypothetical protein
MGAMCSGPKGLEKIKAQAAIVLGWNGSLRRPRLSEWMGCDRLEHSFLPRGPH